MKRIVLFLFIVSAFLQNNAHSALLKTVISKETPSKLRIVLTTDKPVKYTVNKGNSFFVLTIPNLKASALYPKTLKSKLLSNIKIEFNGLTCEVKANYKYLTSASVIKLEKPYRIVIDFNKLSKMLIPKIQVPEIEKVDTKSLPDKFKIVVYLTSFVPYQIVTSESGLILELPDTNSVIKSRKIVTKDKLIPKVLIDQAGKSSVISITQNYPSFYQIFKLENPSRLVIEFDKASKSTVAANEISKGLRLVKIIKGTEEGPSTVNALFIDRTTLEVFPCLAKKKEEGPNFVGLVGSLFTFWMPKEETKHYKARVSTMAGDENAIAGINGTFFGKTGEPLGVLMINGELISYSINDRTALIIDKNGACYIDNVSLYGEVSIEGTPVQISGINNKRQAGEVVVFTPRFGSQTDEDSPGIVLSVIGNEIRNIGRARCWIPEDGYAVSLDPSYYESISNKVRISGNVYLSMKLMPLSAIPNLEIKHVIGGGPRLMKGGQIYITKNSEQFKSDIAKSRAARTAVGVTKDGNLLFVTVDKNKQALSGRKSAGVTLEELAQLMKDLGCTDAMNLDGGSSSTMVINNKVVNVPSTGSEIAVSNSILIR